MSVSAVGQSNTVTQNSATASGSGSASAQLSLNQTYDDFLKLLTTQLKNQDPLAPESSAQFTNQLVLFSQVEQQITTNTNLGQLITNQSADVTQAALGYIGLDVVSNGSQFQYDGKGDSTNLGYTLPTTASMATVGVFDANGVEVWSGKAGSADLTAGAHQVPWDGTDGNGNTLPAGAYTIQVSALDNTNTPITATTQVPGLVTGVSTTNGKTYLNIGNQEIAVSDVISATKPTS